MSKNCCMFKQKNDEQTPSPRLLYFHPIRLHKKWRNGVQLLRLHRQHRSGWREDDSHSDAFWDV